MKFQNCILINFVTDARTHGQAESNMSLHLCQSWGHKNPIYHPYFKISCNVKHTFSFGRILK